MPGFDGASEIKLPTATFFKSGLMAEASASLLPRTCYMNGGALDLLLSILCFTKDLDVTVLAFAQWLSEPRAAASDPVC